jgi:hypothetical protein
MMTETNVKGLALFRRPFPKRRVAVMLRPATPSRPGLKAVEAAGLAGLKICCRCAAGGV